MSDRVRQLEQTSKGHGLLPEALELLPEAIALFDAEDRLVLWNSKYGSLYPDGTALVAGDLFDDMVRRAASGGLVPEALGREDAWIEERLDQHRRSGSDYEQRLVDGRWVRVQERRSRDGWSIGIRTDITEAKQREASIRLLFEANPTPMYVLDRESLAIVGVNDAALRLYGYSRERFLGLTALDIRPASTRSEFLDLVETGAIDDYVGQHVWTHLTADSREIRVRPYTKSLMLDGRLVLLVSVVDQTEQEKIEHEARQTRAFLDSVVASIPVGVFVKDVRDGGRYVLYNRTGEDLVGRSQESIVGRLDHEIFDEAEARRFAEQDREVAQERRLLVFTGETVTRGDGSVRVISTKKLPILDERTGDIRYLLGISEDTTERQRMAKTLDFMAHHDSLTALPNRVVLQQRLEAILERPADCASASALLYIDLDGFKSVNDALGHRTGDALLRIAAERMQALVQTPNLVARLGGDEFVVLQEAIADAAEAIAFADALIRELSAPYSIDGSAVVIAACVGIATFRPSDAIDQQTVLRNADVALYAAKAIGTGKSMLFVPDMDVKARLRRELAADLGHALANGEFQLFYQPIITTNDATLTGFEALVRWQHPVRGFIAPNEFIPLAEELGMIVPIGAWIMARACRDAAGWAANLTVAVNLSPVQFRDNDLPATVAAALAQSGLAANRLELEITESVLLEDSERNVSILHELHDLGLRIALDDFGTGYSSLSYLQRFAFDKIKIDRSFVRGLPDDKRSVAILKAVMALANSLDIITTAEGVETVEQLQCLIREGCGLVQGFLFGKAEPLWSNLDAAVVEPQQVRAAPMEGGMGGSRATLPIAARRSPSYGRLHPAEGSGALQPAACLAPQRDV